MPKRLELLLTTASGCLSFSEVVSSFKEKFANEIFLSWLAIAFTSLLFAVSSYFLGIGIPNTDVVESLLNALTESLLPYLSSSYRYNACFLDSSCLTSLLLPFILATPAVSPNKDYFFYSPKLKPPPINALKLFSLYFDLIGGFSFFSSSLMVGKVFPLTFFSMSGFGRELTITVWGFISTF